MRPYLLLPFVIAASLFVGIYRGEVQAQNSSGNGYSSVTYNVTEDIYAPSSMAGTSHYQTGNYPSSSDVTNTMILAGATIGDATCTMDGYDKTGKKVASNIFCWAASFNRQYKY